jgi:hypothetical protein
MCKAVAKRTELSEDDFWLHKFPVTFATRAHVRVPTSGQ